MSPLQSHLPSTNSVTLAWDAIADQDAGYKVYWGTASGVYDEQSDAQDQTSADHTAFVSGHSVLFRRQGLQSGRDGKRFLRRNFRNCTAKANAHSNSNSNSYPDSHPKTNPNADTYPDPHAKANPNSNAYPDSHPRTNSHANANAEPDPHTNAMLTPTPSPTPRRVRFHRLNTCSIFPPVSGYAAATM